MTVYSHTVDRKDTAALFTSNNPTLANGAIGHETDTGKIKIGDGATAWTSLAYAKTESMPFDLYLPYGMEQFCGADNNVDFMDAAGNVLGMAMGAIASVKGSGFVLTAAKTKAAVIAAEDNDAAITTGSSVRAFEGRVLIGGANTSNDVSIHGVEGHIKIKGAVGSIGFKAGLWGYCELADSANAIASTQCSGVHAMLDIPTSASIAAGAVASGIVIGSNTLAGTHTGEAVCIHVPNPVAGTWDALFEIADSSGCTASSAGSSASKYLVVKVGGTTYKILLLANA
jgi:hypothetical protein